MGFPFGGGGPSFGYTGGGGPYTGQTEGPLGGGGPIGMAGGAMGLPGTNTNQQGPVGGFINGALSGGNTPQQRGYGMMEPPPFQEQQAQAPGAPQGSDMGFGFNQPGAAENYFAQNQGQYTKPGQASQFWDQAKGMRDATDPTGSNYAEKEYLKFNRPDIATSAGLDPYYQNAKKNTSADIDKAFGSRGMFGSGAAMAQQAKAMGDLSAEQANREADYNLRSIGEKRAWDQLGGQLAGSADDSSRAGVQSKLGWMTGLGNLAQGIDATDLAKLQGGMSAAATAQGAGQQRGQDFFNNTMAATMPYANLLGQGYEDLMQNDYTLMTEGMQQSQGGGASAIGADAANTARFMSDSERSAGLLGNVLGGFLK